jgi:hypothetical protein
VDFVELLVILVAPVFRSVAGWLENALEDGSISVFEWGELGATIFRVGVISLGLYFGLDFGAFAAAGSSIVLDFILKALQKK